MHQRQIPVGKRIRSVVIRRRILEQIRIIQYVTIGARHKIRNRQRIRTDRHRGRRRARAGLEGPGAIEQRLVLLRHQLKGVDPSTASQRGL